MPPLAMGIKPGSPTFLTALDAYRYTMGHMLDLYTVFIFRVEVSYFGYDRHHYFDNIYVIAQKERIIPLWVV